MLNSLELTGRAATHVQEFARQGCILHARAGRALQGLQQAALESGIKLEVVSGFRDFKRQLAIWAGKFSGERPLRDIAGRPIERAGLSETDLIHSILIWSALPGASRHHWGSEVDVIDAAALAPDSRPQLLASEFAPEGCFEKLNDWLDSNIRRFGFFRPYGTDRGGVQPEPWHLSYAPVSVPALQGLSRDILAAAIGETDMPGRELVLAQLPQLYDRYVLAVDSP